MHQIFATLPEIKHSSFKTIFEPYLGVDNLKWNDKFFLSSAANNFEDSCRRPLSDRFGSSVWLHRRWQSNANRQMATRQHPSPADNQPQAPCDVGWITDHPRGQPHRWGRIRMYCWERCWGRTSFGSTHSLGWVCFVVSNCCLYFSFSFSALQRLNIWFFQKSMSTKVLHIWNLTRLKIVVQSLYYNNNNNK